MKKYATTSEALQAGLEFLIAAASGVAEIVGLGNCWAIVEEYT